MMKNAFYFMLKALFVLKILKLLTLFFFLLVVQQQSPEACNFIKKETLPRVFSCELCEIFKNTFFIEHFRWLLLVVWENGLIRMLRLITKFMTSQTGRQIITIHILPNISRSKGNRTMAFGQLIEYNM